MKTSYFGLKQKWLLINTILNSLRKAKGLPLVNIEKCPYKK